VSLLALAIWTGCALAESVPSYKAGYKGTENPPGTITGPHKSLWMTEWVACNRLSMKTLAGQLRMKLPARDTALQDARLLSKRAMYLLYETQIETTIGADGCTNGILWRYFHQPRG
jgi:hypothetical protein